MCGWRGLGEKYLFFQIIVFILYGIRPSYLQCIAWFDISLKKIVGGGGWGDTFFRQKQSFILHGIGHNYLQYIAHFNI